MGMAIYFVNRNTDGTNAQTMTLSGLLPAAGATAS